MTELETLRAVGLVVKLGPLGPTIGPVADLEVG